VRYDQVKVCLEQALTLISPGDEEYAEAANLLADTRLNAGLQIFDESLSAGEPVEVLAAALKDLSLEIPSVKGRDDDLKFIDQHLKDAARFDAGENGHAQAVDVLDELSRRFPGYAPAEKLRRNILEDALQRADLLLGKREAERDYALALQHYRLAFERGYDDLRASGLRGKEIVEEEVEKIFRELLLDVDRQLENPDLTEAERQELEKRIQSVIKLDPNRQEATLHQKLNDVRERSTNIREVEIHLSAAETNLALAMKADSYESATTYFNETRNNLERATNVRHYANRKRTKMLWDQYHRHTKLRSDIRLRMEEYRQAKSELQLAPALRLAADTITPEHVGQVQREGAQRLQNALSINRKLIDLDSKNVYLLRDWPDRDVPEHDPLVQDYEYWHAQLGFLNKVGDILQFALRLKNQAMFKCAEGDRLEKNASQDADLQQAAKHWEAAVEELTQAINKLSEIRTLPSPLPHLAALAELQPTIEKVCQENKQNIQRRVEITADRLGQLDSIRGAADQNFNFARHDQAAAEAALNYYDQILRINPLDKDARGRKQLLMQWIEEMNRKRSLWRMIISGGVVLLLLIVVGGLSIQPGAVFNPYTPTPSSTARPTRTIAPTRTLVPSSTITPEPSLTVSPTITHTSVPTATSTHWVCYLEQNTWLSANLSSSARRLVRLEKGQKLTILSPGVGPDGGVWYEIVNPLGDPAKGYINSRFCGD